MITIYIGSINKKVNSTKQSFSGVEVSCALKSRVSIKTPSLLINPTNISIPVGEWNYMQWEDRYYWITNVSYKTNTLVEVQANLDLLATYKNTILNSKALVNYCSIKDENDDIADDARFTPEYLKPVDGVEEEATLYKDSNIFGEYSYLWDDSGDGVVIMQTQSIVGTQNYVLSLQQIHTLLDGMHQVGSTVVNLIAGFFGYSSWMECINSCIWYPIDRTELISHSSALQASKLYIGGVACDGIWGPDIDCYAAPVLWTEHFDGYIDIPRLQSAPRFLWKQRWCTYQLETPFGFQDINADLCYYQHSKIYFSTMWEPGNGNVNIKYVYDASDGFNDTKQTLLCAVQGNMATDIFHLVQQMQNWSDKIMTAVDAGLIMGGAAVVGGAAAGGLIGKAATTKAAPSMANTIAKVEGTQAALKNANTAEKLDYLNSQDAVPQDVEGAKQASTSIGPNLFNLGSLRRCIQPSSAGSSGNSGSGLAGLFNTAQLGLTKLRRKQFICRDLRTGPGTLSENYDAYCEMFGYQRNKIYTLLSQANTNGSLSYFVQGIIYLNSYNMNQNEANAIEQIVSNGIWIE